MTQPPDAATLPDEDRLDRRRVYQYRIYSIHEMTGDESYKLDTVGAFADAVAEAEKHAADCDYVLVCAEDWEQRWVPGHRDRDGDWIPGEWEHECEDGADIFGCKTRRQA